MNRFLPKPITRNKEEQAQFRWKIFWSLLFLFVLAAIANIPHSRAIKTLAYQAGETDKIVNNSILETIAMISGTGLIVGAIFIWIGLWISAKSNLGTPVLSGLISGKSLRKLVNRKVIITSILIGVIVSVILLLLLDIQKLILPIAPAKFDHPSALPNFFAAFSAGVTEEIIFRLGIMSLFVVVLQYLFKTKASSNSIIWIANITVGLIFGLIHLPMSSNYWELTPIVIGTTILGNLITGTAFGWVFWRYGLLMAMLAHFSFDIVFHVIGSPFG